MDSIFDDDDGNDAQILAVIQDQAKLKKGILALHANQKRMEEDQAELKGLMGHMNASLEENGRALANVSGQLEILGRTQVTVDARTSVAADGDAAVSKEGNASVGKR